MNMLKKDGNKLNEEMEVVIQLIVEEPFKRI